jgi:uncharacterized protein (DUF1501 family)
MTQIIDPTPLNRRRLLGLGAGLGATAAFGGFIPRTASAAGSRQGRLVVIILRGALDGLSAAPPVGDPDYAPLRGDLAYAATGDGAVLKLDGFFGLHPAMSHTKRLYDAGQASLIHASATGYRERSHFDGQDVLESGLERPGTSPSGWMNRLISTLSPAQMIKPSATLGLGIGSTTPLILRGPANSLGWAPPILKPVDPNLPGRLMDLYSKSDPALAKVLQEAIETGKIAAGMSTNASRGGPSDPDMMVQMSEGAARLMAADDGPRLCALAFEGWDTHATEANRLARLLGGLDRSLAAFETHLGPVWQDTAVLVVTEFGRTVRVNGTSGTDHGTGAAAFLAGGAIRGGRVIADWPGLTQAKLYENRDLYPTTDIRGVIKELAVELFDTSPQKLGSDVFPGTLAIAPVAGLLA